MNPTRHLIHSVLACLSVLIALPLLAQQEQAPITELNVSQVFVGEAGNLNIQVPAQPQGTITVEGGTPLELSNHDVDYISPTRTYCQNIGITSDRPGRFELPPLKIPTGAGEFFSSPVTLEVFSHDRINWTTLELDEKTLKCGTAILFPSGPIYEGQSIPITAKVLIPFNERLNSYGHSIIEKLNIGAWRLELPFPANYDQVRSRGVPAAVEARKIKIGSEAYKVISYTTTAAPLSSGSVTLGPGKVESLQTTIRQTSNNRSSFGVFNFAREYSVNLALEFPKVTFTAKALPSGAPASFQGAIGKFSLEATLDNPTSLTQGDPLMVQLALTGSGNLETLSAPVLDGPESTWKLYPATRNETSGERRSNRGTVVFSQILRPERSVSEIPSFLFSFFNPESESYETLRSAPIPIALTSPSPSNSSASISPPPAGLVPVAQMTDILGLIDPKPFTLSRASSSETPPKWWHLIPALGSAALLVFIARQHLSRFSRTSSGKKILQQELQTLAAEKSPSDFLRKAANLAQKHNLDHPDDDFVGNILNKRDAICFQPNPAETLPNQSRQEILKGLRERLAKVLLATVTCGLFLSSEGQALSHSEALAAWQAGDYATAKDLYQDLAREQPTPDHFFNLGNCYYRLEQPARAALNYRKALQLQPSHAESLQNLDFVERKLGAIPTVTLQTPSWTQRLSLSRIQFLIQLALWLTALSLLASFAFTAYRRRLRLCAVTCTCLALPLACLWFFYPKPRETAPTPNAVIIASEPVAMRTEASTTGSIILTANPSTSCEIIAARGAWSYVALPDETRGWLPSEALESI